MSFLPRRRKIGQPTPMAPSTDTAHPLVLRDERMASHITSVCFTVHLDGSWRWIAAAPVKHHDPGMLARDHLRQQVADILRRHSVLNAAAAQDAVNTALMQWTSAVSGLEVAGAARLDVPIRDREVAQEHIRRQQTADLEHEEEMYRLAHLQRVLADPHLRRVWWVAQSPGRFSDLNSLKEALEELPLPREPEDDGVRGDIRRFTDQLVTALHTQHQREVFLTALGTVLNALGHHDLKKTAAQWLDPHDPGSTPS
ncbi:hypothetical protein ACIRPQ_21800 [Streptomyces sp. NPDC101213]|uniref:hypothetical protein n=1 Tax=Streptomyces sp. NPDC101213 TaxID=3366130 RepID=UPI003813122B